MDYLGREGAPFSEELWQKIDDAVVSSARKLLIGRRFLPVFGPIGQGARNINIDSKDKTEQFEDGIVVTTGRQYVEIPQLYDDFWLLWRDLEASQKSGYPVDLSMVMGAAERLSRLEDKLIFFGNKKLGINGLLEAPGINKKKLSDWMSGENAFIDVASGLTLLDEKGLLGKYTLIVSPDLHLALQRIQPGMNIVEVDRIAKLVQGKVYRAPVLGSKKAVLVCCEPQYMDLVIGQDMAASYLEAVDLNHHLRVLETIVPRIKRPEAVVAFT